MGQQLMVGYCCPIVTIMSSETCLFLSKVNFNKKNHYFLHEYIIKEFTRHKGLILLTYITLRIRVKSQNVYS